MSERAGLRLLIVLLGGGWLGLGYIIFYTTPDALASRLLFFTFFFIALFGMLGLVAYLLSFRLFSLKLYRGNVARSMQQGALLATFLLIAALLQMTRALALPSGLLLAGTLCLAEWFTLTRK
ncbi:MAG: hypothetical protein M1136_06280 [Chloroflexi bacterium]|nr:hypothetical protein [Chloroflexota bacterium]MCL5075238.1 hypothetical protein [Chloroflexota bacterium]